MSRDPPPRFCTHSPEHGTSHKVGTSLLEPTRSWFDRKWIGECSAHSAGRRCQLGCSRRFLLRDLPSRMQLSGGRFGFHCSSQTGLFMVGEPDVPRSCEVKIYLLILGHGISVKVSCVAALTKEMPRIGWPTRSGCVCCLGSGYNCVYDSCGQLSIPVVYDLAPATGSGASSIRHQSSKML
jgi:hypothetical protein